MKKTVLFLAVAFLAIGMNAQKVWNFSNTPFGTAVPTYTTTTIADGLKIMAADLTTVIVDANGKKNLTASAASFTHRIKMGGSGAPDRLTAPNMPTTRALVFNVSGPGLIKICCLSSSSSAARKITITNGTDSLGFFDAPGTYTDAETNTVGLQTFNYTGGAATLYLYSPSSGVNIYYLEATTYSGAPSKVNTPLADSGLKINTHEIYNPKNLAIEVYSILGKKLANSTTNISTKNFQKGIYFVRIAGTNEALKFSI